MPASRQSSTCRASGQPGVQLPDARAQKRADLVPSRRDHSAGDRKADADVELPQAAARRPRGSPNSSAAIIPPGRTTRASSARVAAGSSTYRRRYVNVSASNDAVGKRQLVGAALDELDPLREPCRRDARPPRGEHLRALVDARRRCIRAAGRARSQPPPSRSPRRALRPRARSRSARPGSAASAGPARARAAGSSGRTSARAGRRARAPPGSARRERPRAESKLASWA